MKSKKTSGRIIRVLCTIAVVASLHISAEAIDTNEPYAVGPFTYFEAYLNLIYGKEGLGNSWYLRFGGGFSKNVSYYVQAILNNVGDSVEFGYNGWGFIWTPVATKNFSFDIMPMFSFMPNTVQGKISYPGFDGFYGTLQFEGNVTAYARLQPFFRVGGSVGYNDKNKDVTYEIPLDLGVVCPLKKGVEFLMIGTLIPNEQFTWEDTGRAVKLGVNIAATERLEVLTEMGWMFPNKGFTVGVGLIYMLPDNMVESGG
jgi:hypothetical protein